MWKRGTKDNNEEKTEDKNMPIAFSIRNYPNPCNPSTTFNMDIPIAGNVQLKLYDAMGREISTLVDRYMAVGTHSVIFDGKNLPTGTYIYRMVSGSFIKTGKILLMK
jgi:hypothetical protein